jgi:Protein of unknown function (DUF3592)
LLLRGRLALFILLTKLATMVFVTYKLSGRSPFTLRGIGTYGLVIVGVMACFDGFSLAYHEERRARDGRVSSGVVVEKLSSTGAQGSRRIGRWGGRDQVRTRPIVTIKGFQFHDVLARTIATGSPSAWVIDYRLPCDSSYRCFARDFVTEDLWMRLRAGQPVNVRQAGGESTTGRLDENPQWRIATADFAIGAALLCVAGLLSGRITVFRTRRWVTAPAVVLAVEPVRNGEDAGWRVRFAYFDREGVPQESAAVVASTTYKVGDACVAVFQPAHADLATLQPAEPVG